MNFIEGVMWVLFLAGGLTFIFIFGQFGSIGEASKQFCQGQEYAVSSNGRTFCNSKEYVCDVDTLNCFYVAGD